MAKHIAEFVASEIERLAKLVDRIGTTEEQRAIIALAASKLNDKFNGSKEQNHHVEQVQQANPKRTGLLFDEPIDAPPLAGRMKPTDEDFGKFWKVYPRKCSKQKARIAFEKAFRKLRATKSGDEALVTIIAGAIVYGKKVNPESICHPTTWLNGERWEDDPEHIATPAFGDAEKASRLKAARYGSYVEHVEEETDMEAALRVARGLPSLQSIESVIETIKGTWNPDEPNEEDVYDQIRETNKSNEVVRAVKILSIEQMVESEPGTSEFKELKRKFDYMLDEPNQEKRSGKFDKNQPHFTFEEQRRWARV